MAEPKDWNIKELTEEEVKDLETFKGDLSSCQDAVPDGETGWGDHPTDQEEDK